MYSLGMKMMKHRSLTMKKILNSVAAAVFSLAIHSGLTAHAQDYPSKPVRIVISSTPASGLDLHARLIANSLALLWKQSVLVDYKPGGGMAIGAAYVAKSPADGYTLYFSIDSPFVINPLAMTNLPYKIADFAPISFWSLNPFVLLVNSELQVKSVPELIDHLRVNPGRLNAASASALTLLSHELFRTLARVEYSTITYKGGTESMASLMSGETQLAFYDLGNAQAGIKAGKLRVIAQTPLKRASILSDIPTIAESGVPGFETGTWGAMFAPVSTPSSIISKINTDMRTVLASSEMIEKLRTLGVEPHASSPEELSSKIGSDAARWAKLIKERGITLSQ